MYPEPFKKPNAEKCILKMLGHFLYTLLHVIGHKSCNMLSILNKLTLQKELPNVVTNNALLGKQSKNTTVNKTKLKHENRCRSGELNLGPHPPTSDALSTTAPPSQLRVTNVVKLLNCFVAMGQNVNKQNRICGPHIFNKFIIL